MSGVQIHTSDPINPAKSKASTATASSLPHNYQPSQSTANQSGSSSYPSAQPAQGVPAPTKTVSGFSPSGPPPPQPGAVPAPAPPATTAKATLPPPPKAGEKPLPPSAYTAQLPPATKHASSPTHPYPPQMSMSVQETRLGGMPYASSTSSTTNPSVLPSANLSASTETAFSELSLDHPPGYVQNRHATDMTAEQRLAAQKEEASNRSRQESVLGYAGPGGGGGGGLNNGGDTAAGIWEGAKSLAGQVGQKAGELHGEIWDRINNKGS